MVRTVASLSVEDVLLRDKLVTTQQLDQIRREAQQAEKPVEELIRAKNVVSEEDLTRARSESLGVPYVDLQSRTLDAQVKDKVPMRAVMQYKIIPFELVEGRLRVAMVDPTDLRAQEAVEFISNQQKLVPEIYITSQASFDHTLGGGSVLSREVDETLKDIETLNDIKKIDQQVEEAAPIQHMIKDAPISKIVGVVLRYAIEGGASDIHIEPEDDKLRVRYRIDGVLRSTLVLPKAIHPSIVSRVKILSNLKIDVQRLPQDGRFNSSVLGKSVDFRVSTMPTVNGEKVAMRVLDKSVGVPTFKDLGIVGRRLTTLQENIRRPFGMLLVTGPTGSGKTTTLYSVLGVLNQESVNIVTLEDPVEYFVENINQSQVRPDIGFTFANGLRSILRQDPDVIMVGEIRDAETAELAVHSALTGHLVLSTLHTQDAIGAIPRLVDMGVESFLMTAALNMVAAQRLVRRVCPHCVKTFKAPDDVAKQIEEVLAAVPKDELKGLKNVQAPFTLYHGEGCAKCGGEGYKGRIGIFEIIAVTPEMQALVQEKANKEKMEELARKQGMVTMYQDGVLKALNGITTMEEVIRVSRE